MKKSNKSYIW